MRTRTWIGVMAAGCVLAMAAMPADAATLTYGDNIHGLVKMITIGTGTPAITVVAGLSFDPTYRNPIGNYDRVYLANRSADDNLRGLYSVLISTETVSGRLALAGVVDNTALDEPYATVTSAAGDVYVAYSVSASVWKVTDPSGTPTETKILGNYGASTADDDPISIAFVPPGFGLAGYDTSDLLLLDNGIDSNNYEGLTALKADGSAYTILCKENDTVSNDVRGASNPVDSEFYFSRMAAPTVNISGTDYPTIYRIGSDGVIQTIALTLPPGETFTALDDSLTVNPADGSVWFVSTDAASTMKDRSIFRVDPSTAVDQGGGVYLASATLEIDTTGEVVDDFNVGVNDLAFSPDGELLAVGCPSGVDTMYVFRTTIPEPGSLVLLVFGLASLTVLRRRRS